MAPRPPDGCRLVTLAAGIIFVLTRLYVMIAIFKFKFKFTGLRFSNTVTRRRDGCPSRSGGPRGTGTRDAVRLALVKLSLICKLVQ